jgi:hypothetical protein
MRTRLFLVIVSATLLAGELRAQQQPLQHRAVICVKVLPGKAAEYRQFINNVVKPIWQAQADSGAIVSWSLLRTVMPAGTEARCDYKGIAVYESTPPVPMELAGLDQALKKAGLKMTAAEFLAKRDTLVRLVSSEIWRVRIRVGQPQKGHYLFVN